MFGFNLFCEQFEVVFSDDSTNYFIEKAELDSFHFLVK